MRGPRNLYKHGESIAVAPRGEIRTIRKSHHRLQRDSEHVRRRATQTGVWEKRTVVVTADLFLVLRLRVHDDLRDENGENVLEELERERHLRPVMTLLHNVEHVAWRTNSTKGSAAARCCGGKGATYR